MHPILKVHGFLIQDTIGNGPLTVIVWKWFGHPAFVIRNSNTYCRTRTKDNGFPTQGFNS